WGFISFAISYKSWEGLSGSRASPGTAPPSPWSFLAFSPRKPTPLRNKPRSPGRSGQPPTRTHLERRQRLEKSGQGRYDGGCPAVRALSAGFFGIRRMLEFLTELARSPNHPLGLFVLLASSAVEYLFPPFPGD